MKNDVLKPCPFCGSTYVLFDTYGYEKNDYGGADTVSCSIACRQCGANGGVMIGNIDDINKTNDVTYFPSNINNIENIEKECIKYWNMRKYNLNDPQLINDLRLAKLKNLMR